MDLLERPVQLRGSAIARGALRLAGRQLRFDGLPARQGVAIVCPHTSNWLALAPEGTRKFQDTWRSGFYHVTLVQAHPGHRVGERPQQAAPVKWKA